MDKKAKLSVLAVLMLSASVTCAVASDSDDDSSAATKRVVAVPLRKDAFVGATVPSPTKVAVVAATDSSDDENDAPSVVSQPVKKVTAQDKKDAFARVLRELEGDESRLAAVERIQPTKGFQLTEEEKANNYREILAEYYLSGGLFESKAFIEKLVRKHEGHDSSRAAPAARAMPSKSVASASLKDAMPSQPSVVMVSASSKVVARDITVEESVAHASRMAVLSDQVEAIMSQLQPQKDPRRNAPNDETKLELHSIVLRQLQALRGDNLPPHFAKALDVKISGVEAEVKKLSESLAQSEAISTLDDYNFAAHVRGSMTRRLFVKQYKADLAQAGLKDSDNTQSMLKK